MSKDADSHKEQRQPVCADQQSTVRHYRIGHAALNRRRTRRCAGLVVRVRTVPRASRADGAGQRMPRPPDLLRCIRLALRILPEEPPLALGRSLLARELLGSHDDVLQRGMLLKQVLLRAIEQLQPSHIADATDRRWWPYQICVAEYLQGQSRHDTQVRLAVSASTYSRAKRDAFDRLTALLPRLLRSGAASSDPDNAGGGAA